MKTVKVTLGLRIENYNVFYAGQTTYRESIWVISDQISQPAWWTTYATDRYNSVEYVFLGEYSDKKYGLLIEVTGVSDWTDLSTDERRVLALQLKRYLAKNIVYEDVESAVPVRMTVTVMG